MKITSVHVIIPNSNGQILLTQRQDFPLWVIPGGHVEKNESSINAAIREIKEEIGLNIKITTTLATYVKASKTEGKQLFLGKIQSGKIKYSYETRKIAWFFPKKLPSPMTLYEKEKINDFLKYKNKEIKRADILYKYKELINQISHPFAFISLFVCLIKNKMLNKNTFKFRLE